MKLFKYENYKITISEEALCLKPFKEIWKRDKSTNKEKALMELGFIYFLCDPRSDYQYIIDKEEREEAIKEGEGFPAKWKPDKLIIEAMKFYDSFKPSSVLLLEDVRCMIDKFRKALKDMEFDCLTVKELSAATTIIKQVPSLVENLDEAEKAVTKEYSNSGKMRGQAIKSIMEDGPDI